MAEQRYVYLMRLGEHCKIGQSTSPAHRCAEIVSAVMPEVIHAFSCPEARCVERMLHGLFKARRLRGEWFALDPEDVALICSIGDCARWMTCQGALAATADDRGC